MTHQNPDLWAIIRQEYELTNMSVMALAKKYDVTLEQIEIRRAAEDWPRDQEKEIMAAASAKLVMAGMPDGTIHGRPAFHEADRLKMIDQASDRIVDVLNTHKKSAKAGIELVQKIFDRLQATDGLVKVYDMMGNEHDVDAIKQVKDLASALKNLVGIDRATYALDDYRGLGSPHALAQRGEDEVEARRAMLDRSMREMMNRAQRHLRVVK